MDLSEQELRTRLEERLKLAEELAKFDPTDKEEEEIQKNESKIRINNNYIEDDCAYFMRYHLKCDSCIHYTDEVKETHPWVCAQWHNSSKMNVCWEYKNEKGEDIVSLAKRKLKGKKV